jgi:hypothetical protein
MDPSDFYANIRQAYRLFREELYQLYLGRVDEEKATYLQISSFLPYE